MKIGKMLLAILLILDSALIAQTPSRTDTQGKQNAPSKDKTEEPFRLDAQPSVETPTSTFTAKSELVLVPVTVLKSGAHVSGLKKDDFRLLENGIEKKVAIFEEVRPSANAARPKLAPGEFSNAVGLSDKPQALNIIVLSAYGSGITDQTSAQFQLIKYLGRWAETREPISIMVLSGGTLYSLFDFNTDPNILVAAVRKINLKQSRKHAAAAPPELKKRPTAAPPPPTHEEAVDRLAANLSDFRSFGGYELRGFEDLSPLQRRMEAYKVLDAMRYLAQVYAGVPGRKSLIWIAGTLPYEGQTFGNTWMASDPELNDRIHTTWKLLNAANTAVYPIAPGIGNLNNPMADYADATGGKFLHNRNDIDMCFQEAVKDSGDYYLLGYYLTANRNPSAQSNKNRRADWRKLRVKIARQGLEVRAKKGFFVGNPESAPKDAAKFANDEEARAIFAPIDYTAIQIGGRWGPITESGDGKKHVEFELKLPAGFAKLDEEHDNRISVDFVAVAKGINGEVVSQASRHLQVRIPALQLQKYYTTRTVYRYALEVPRGEYTVRFIVRDNLTGQMGSVSTPLKVN